jgi:RNA polymerase sigma-70 factor (ECF subfamily)
MVSNNDQSLAQRAAAGDPAAFDQLVGRYQDRVYGLTHRLVGDADLAMDLSQETFLRAWRGIASFEGQSEFFTWLWRIARNVVISHGRSESVRPKLVSNSGGEEESVVHEPVAASPAPESRLVREDERRSLLRALRALPFEFREVLVLRDMEDRPYEEIAVLLQVPLGTVRSRLHRARLALREHLRLSLGLVP